jgi:fibronectin type 3 domain-containing protein
MNKYLLCLIALCLLTNSCSSSNTGEPTGGSNAPGASGDTTPPTTPGNLNSAVAGIFPTRIELEWDAATDNVGVSEYIVYRCTVAACTPTVRIASVSSRTYNDTGLASNTLYRYAVSARDAAGNESPLSIIYEASTPPPPTDATPPTPPVNLTAAPISSTQIDLGWDASTDNVGVVSYSIHRCAGTGCTPSTVIATISNTAYADTGLNPSTTYVYALSARDAADNQSLPSTSASATTLAPPADTTPPTVPSGLTATPVSPTQINLSWQGSTDNVGVESYTIHRCQGTGCTTMTQIATVPSGTLSYQDTGLTGNSTYRYAVSASDQAGNDSPLSSPPVTAATPAPPDTTMPTVPTGLTATAQSSSRIDLSWQASTDNVGVTRYSVYRCTGATCTPTPTQAMKVSDITTGTAFSNTGLTASTTYQYIVTASDAAGNESGPSTPPQTATTQPPAGTQIFTLIGAGDIATSASSGEPTAKLLDAAVAADPNAIVFTTGDNAYDIGSASDFSSKYHPTWGRHKAQTRPSPGNHDYGTAGALGYLNYFCPNSADCSFPGGTQQLYYSYNLGDWHIVSLDSEANTTANSAQLTWLRNDLAAHPNSCVLAYWHRPRFTSGSNHSDFASVQPFWEALSAAKADVVVVGHNHQYERFAKQNPSQQADPAGIRQFVVGTGGAGAYGFGTPKPLSEVRFTSQSVKGVIKFTLRNGSYDWSFLKTDGTIGDSGTNNTCNK